jgi:murein DD-endopeptidase MepM/ murein hydrolase activator NlpD
MQVQTQFHGHGLDAAHDAGRANFIRILHADGSMAVYAHLAEHGALVRQGQPVETGQRIGLSGNTGYSTAPHLHFAVQVNRGGQLTSIPFRLAKP